MIVGMNASYMCWFSLILFQHIVIENDVLGLNMRSKEINNDCGLPTSLPSFPDRSPPRLLLSVMVKLLSRT